VAVTIVGVAVTTENQTGPDGERSDTAAVGVLLGDGTSRIMILDLQVPERAVVEAQLSMIRDAQANGETLELTVENDTHRIVSVRSGGGGGLSGGRGNDESVDGFVESISHSSDSSTPGNFAIIEFTTAPPFSIGTGHVVKLIPFLPKLVQLLVVIGSPEYKLFLVGLRDKLRMRVLASEIATDKRDDSTNVAPAMVKADGGGQPAGGTPNASAPARSDARVSVESGDRTIERTEIPSRYLVRGAKLLHALASASRPVWIQVSRKSLDVGPEAACTDGLPSNDLRPRTLRDLCLPYTAEWIGWGCFNHGVYRFQFELETDFEVEVDCKPLCVHASDDGKTQFAHACLDCEHEVRVRLKAWTCEQDFKMDVYRIR
jgi:hypothetical protein